MPRLLVTLEYQCREAAVFFRMGAVVVVETHIEISEVRLVLFCRGRDQCFRCNTLLACPQHDGRAVGVIGADIGALLATQALETCPDIRLDIFDHMANVDRAIGIR